MSAALGCVSLFLVSCSGPSSPDASDTTEPTVSSSSTTSTAPPTGTASSEPAELVVIVGIDGAGGHFITDVDTPNLDALVNEGVSTLEMQNVLPTSSSTNWMSMIGGTTPDQHGILSNGWQPGDSSPPPTLFATLADQRPDALMGVFHDWADFGRLVESGIADIVVHPGNEQQTLAAALGWMASEQPQLMFIHLDHVDHAGHLTTWGSDNYDSALEEADALVGQLVTALKDAGVWEQTALIVSADHGGEGFSHGADTFDERAIPFIMTAPWISGPRTLQRETRIFDIAPTAARALGIEPDPSWVGRAIPEVWEDLPPGPEQPIAVVSTDSWSWVFDDAGSGAASDLSIWSPDIPVGFTSLGDAAVAGYDPPVVGSMAVDPMSDGVMAPIGYEEMWNTVGSGANNDVALWNPIPEPGYVCLGNVASATPGVPPDLDATVCIHGDAVLVVDRQKVWDDTLSGAAWDAGLWSCVTNGTLSDVPLTVQTRRDHDDPGSNRCWGFSPDHIAAP